MSSVKTYVAAKRGKLVVVPEDNSAPVYSVPDKVGKTTTGEVLYGPVTVGTATGNVYVDGDFSWIEVVRVGATLLFGVPIVTMIYVYEDVVKLKENPSYDASKDTGAATTGGTTTADPTGSTQADPDTVPISKNPGPGRVPVVGSNGETVYVLVPAPTTTTTGTIPTETTDKTKKYLTWGLYGILGLGAATLIVILIMSIRKPKTKPKP